MKTRKIPLYILSMVSFNALCAEVPTSDTGVITIKGNVYASSCVISSASSTALKIAIPTTVATSYAKGDASPLSTKGAAGSFLTLTCPSNAGISIRVDGTADSNDTSLYEVTPGTGKAQGVAIKLLASSGISGTDTSVQQLNPNKLSSSVFGANAVGMYTINFQAQTVATADKVVAGDLSTALTWTAVYN